MKQSSSLEQFRSDLQEIFDSILTIKYYQYINGALFANRKTLKLNAEADLKIFMHTQSFEKENYIHNSLYISLIAVLESYLQDRLAEELKGNQSKVATLILHYDLGRKLAAQDIINGPSVLAEEILHQVLYHNFKKVNTLYKIVFGIDILSLNTDKRLFEIIKVRHNIVHRAGRIQEKKLFVRSTTLLKDMTLISRWVENIDHQILKGSRNKSSPDFMNRYTRQLNQLAKSALYKTASQGVFDRELEKLYEPAPNQTPHISI